MLVSHIRRRHIYWLGQIMGWSAYGGMLAALYVLSEKLALTPRISASIILETAGGLFITHGFRYYIRKYQWIKLPIYELLLKVMASNLIMAVLFLGLNIVIYQILGIAYSEKLTRFILFSTLINNTLLFIIWSFTYFASGFFSNFRRREIEHLRWEGAIKDFELNKLKSQLNPHFVFNALNSIRSLVEEDPERAKKSITQLSNILRNSLIADRSKFITLEEEMRTVNDYINLEKLRYEERIQVTIDLEPESLKIPVPPMMIQTLVENAVKHGISKQVRGGVIEIETQLNKKNLLVTIKNSGKLNLAEKSSTGFGIINTRQRLELLYGKAAEFNINQEAENLVNVNLLLPTK